MGLLSPTVPTTFTLLLPSVLKETVSSHNGDIISGPSYRVTISQAELHDESERFKLIRRPGDVILHFKQ